MNVRSIVEGFYQPPVFREVRQYSQLYLRIVGVNKPPLTFSNENLPQLPSHFQSDRYVLQVRLACAQSSRYCDSLIETRVQPLCFLVDEFAESVYISRF